MKTKNQNKNQEPEQFIRMECECSKPPASFRNFCKSEEDYKIMTQPVHELVLTLYYPTIKYRCSKCGEIKTITLKE